MLNHNQNVTARKFELQAYVDVINTADAFKLSRLSEYLLNSLFIQKHLFIQTMTLYNRRNKEDLQPEINDQTKYWKRLLDRWISDIWIFDEKKTIYGNLDINLCPE